MLHGQNFYVESTPSSSPMHKTVDPSQFCIDGSYYKKKFRVSSAIICTSPRIVPQFFSVIASDCSIISGLFSYQI
uniref:Putative ovule protein n=1 Tax=Solanum chacoense TaxID=4108 RepID=A0A0V0IH41_SOLCH